MAQQAKDVGNAKQVEEAELLTELERRNELEAIRGLLNCSGGRSFLTNIMRFCAVHSSAPYDPVPMNRYEGRRDVGIFIRKECLTADAVAYSLVEQASELIVKEEE